MAKNRLIHEKSPYLLQHAHNPVDWFAWGEEAFVEAKRRDLPIFLSIGYATCHWCHVMERESFEDLEIATLLNEAFINIKVDREELPAVDSTYMEFAQVLMSSSGGWPLNVLLTPDLKPFFAMTYLPKESRKGQIGMREFIPHIAELWKGKERKLLIEQAEKLVAAFKEALLKQTAPELPTRSTLEDAIQELEAQIDPVYGGLKGAPKFPFSTASTLLYVQGIGALATLSLEKMQQGGIYDVLGGGFSRYAVDAEWKIPHFEKMLYDNALLSEAYLNAWKVTKKDSFAQTAKETLNYLLREMCHPEGGFYSAQDADSEGKEGIYYTWSWQEIQQLLPPESVEQFCTFYSVTKEGNFELRNVLYALGPAETELLRKAKELLFQERKKRTPPLTDDKIITAWNGLMIDVLAKAASAFQERRFLDQAIKTAHFIKNHLQGKKGLLRRFREGEAKFEGVLDDYAFLIKGLLTLFEEGAGTEWLEWALALSCQIEEKFRSETGAFYYQEEDPLVRRFEFYDAAEPSGNAVHCENLLRLYQLTQATHYLTQAEGILKGAKHSIEAYPPGCCYHLLNLQRYFDPKALTIVIALDERATMKLDIQKILSSRFLPHHCVIYKERNDSKLTELIPSLIDKNPVNGQTAIYICTKEHCEVPVTELATIEGIS